MMTTIEYVTIEDMMYCREHRCFIQQNMQTTFHSPVISFSMNIPGPVKTSETIRKAFDCGCDEIYRVLSIYCITILSTTVIHEKTGDELLLCVDANAIFLKEQLCKIEEMHPLGRLFDIDIIDKMGRKLSRSSYRKCILCNCQAQECARSRKHSLQDMQDKITSMLENYDFN